MQIKQIYMSLLVGMLAIVLSGCFPFGPEEVSEFDVVATFYNESFNLIFSIINSDIFPGLSISPFVFLLSTRSL